jgi:hypothetical protein
VGAGRQELGIKTSGYYGVQNLSVSVENVPWFSAKHNRSIGTLSRPFRFSMLVSNVEKIYFT